MQTNPQVLPLQLAVALVGAVHATQALPQVATLPLFTQTPAQL